MALGARNIADGRVYTSLGSSSWVAVSSDKPLLCDRAKPYVFTHVMPGMFTSAVGVFSTGTSLKWVRDNVCANLVAEAEHDGSNVWEKMIALAAGSEIGANKLLFNPSLAGGSSMEASPHIRGGFLGLDLGHTQADLIRATMEGISLNLRMALDELRSLCDICDEMVAVGGGSQSPLWQQIYADALNIKMVKTNVGQEAGSLGAAAVAAVGAGLWSDFDKIDQVHQVEGVAEPIAENAARYEKLLAVFRHAAGTQAELGDRLAELDL
jgi:xylulokinase